MQNNLPTLPAGWSQKTVGEISKIQSGFPVNKKNEIENGYVHLRTHNISTSGKLNFDYLVKVENSMIKANCNTLKKDDILFNNTNSTELVGKTALVDQDYPYAFSNHLTKVELDQNITLPSFFVYYFMDLFTKEYFVSICNKWIGQSGVNTTMLKEITIPLPPLDEQKRLVALLDTLFAKIDRSIELLSENIVAADALLPSALNTVFGELREKYASKAIEEIAYIKGGKRIPKGNKLLETKTNYPYIRVTDFTDDGTIDTNNIQYISEEIYREIKNYTITSNDLYISIAGTIGKTGIIPSSLDGANLTENAAKLVYKVENINNYFTQLSHIVFSKSAI